MARGLGRGRGAPASAQPESDEPERQGEFDAFQGGDAGIFARGGEYDDEDKEADAIWASIDDHMDSRRRDQREARLKAELEQYRKDNPKITEQFADAKRKLAAVSYDEWDAIPEIGDYTIKRAKQGREFVPAPDTLLQKALAEKETEAYADDDDVGGGGGGGDDRLSDLNAVGEGRSSVLGLKLDGLSDSVSGQTVVDPKGYLTSLSGIKISSQAEISDVKKARLLLKSVIGTNPKHAPGWIAAARLEELAGKLQAARSFIQRGCDACPQSQDVWIEAARLNNPETARAILARGVVSLPRSTEIWIAAAKLEETDERKRRVLRKALENVPNSVRLWKAVVDLSAEEDARVLLSRAVECCPQHADLWLALARLETRDKARVVLNKARETLPTEPGIWIAAAKLEEANDNAAIVGRILERAVKSLAAHGVAIDREFWLKEAEKAEMADPPSLATCREMVRVTISAGVEEIDQKRTFKADAEECARRGSLHTARAIYAVACERFPGKKSVWVGAANLEKRAKDPEAMDAVLRRAVTHCPRAEILWLMAAKERWTQGDVPGARDVLEEAFAANPDSEDIWLAAFKLEFENREPERARALLAKVREKGAGERVWMKSAIVEREVGDADAERALLVEGLDKFPASWKMWIMLGQLEARSGPARVEAARDAYAKGCRRCPTAAPLWIAAAKLETTLGNARARAPSSNRRGFETRRTSRCGWRRRARSAHRGTRTGSKPPTRSWPRRCRLFRRVAHCGRRWCAPRRGPSANPNPWTRFEGARRIRGSSPPSRRSSGSIARRTRRGAGSTAPSRSTRTSAITGPCTTTSRDSTAGKRRRRRSRRGAPRRIRRTARRGAPCENASNIGTTTHGRSYRRWPRRWSSRGEASRGGQPERGVRLERGGAARSSANASLWKNTHLCISYTPAYAGPDPDSTTTHLHVKES